MLCVEYLLIGGSSLVLYLDRPYPVVSSLVVVVVVVGLRDESVLLSRAS